MKKVERKLNKAQLATIWLLIISVVLTGAYLIFLAIANKRALEAENAANAQALIELKPGESYSFNNSPMAYPAIAEKEILFVDITNHKTEERFGIFREPDENDQPNGSFMFHYYDDFDDPEAEAEGYLPPIVSADTGFVYEDLYAVEGNDGFGRIYYLTYLCSALGNPLFSERIELPMADDLASENKRNDLLRDCGLTKSEVTEVLVQYCKRDPSTNEIIKDSENTHLIRIGGKALSGVGYYFMVDDRPYIYYTNSEYLSYAVMNFSSFIKGVLISKGLSNDSVYGPYLTTEFTSWHGTQYTSGTIALSSDPTRRQDPLVMAYGNYKSTLKSGYDSGVGELKFDLEALKNHPDYKRIESALVGKSVQKYTTPILLTLINELSESSNRVLDFSSSDSLAYSYTITQIESVITTTGERVDGTVGDGDNLIKVTYSYTHGGKTEENCHAVINRSLLGTEDAGKFTGKSVGASPDWAPFTIEVTYTRDNALETQTTYRLREVLAVFDEKGALTDTITETTYVNISYDIEIDGQYSETKTHPVRLADLKENHKLYSLKALLLGKTKGEYDETIYDSVTRYEYMRDFSTYELSEITSFVVNEIVVSFSFVNASERDPYYGESFYKNKLENEYKIYGLNAGSCESAVKLLGGVGSDGNSAAGLAGETVAIGLSAKNMMEYGLYAHKIYFEMPRMIYDASEGTSSDSDDVLSDFAWIDTLGFTLYISDATYDENGNRVRYIGSDMYDIVAKVYTTEFDFVEYDFVEFWARKSMVMMDIAKLDEMKLEFNMVELTGSYTFDVGFTKGYSGYDANGQPIFSLEKFDGAQPYTRQEVRVTASSDAFATEFTKMFGTTEADLAWLYKQTVGAGTNEYYPGSHETLGASYFNAVYSILQLTGYVDCLDKAEQEIGFTKYKVMSMHVKVEGQEYYYTYDFYRIDDRRIMVALYKTNADGQCIDDKGNVVPVDQVGEYTVSDFYIDAYGFKKLVNAYIYLLNGQAVDESVGYPAIKPAG